MAVYVCMLSNTTFYRSIIMQISFLIMRACRHYSVAMFVYGCLYGWVQTWWSLITPGPAAPRTYYSIVNSRKPLFDWCVYNSNGGDSCLPFFTLVQTSTPNGGGGRRAEPLRLVYGRPATWQLAAWGSVWEGIELISQAGRIYIGYCNYACMYICIYVYVIMYDLVCYA